MGVKLRTIQEQCQAEAFGFYKSILRTPNFLPVFLSNCIEYGSFLTFALFKMPKLSPAAGKIRYNLHYRPFLAFNVLYTLEK